MSQAAKKPSSFQFVTFGDIFGMKDPAAISRIRKHAMRDIGITRRKPTKKKKKRYLEIELEIRGAETEEDDNTTSSTITPYDTSRSVSPIAAIGGGGIHTFFHLPITLDSTGKSLLANIFRDDSTSRQTAHREDWFNVGIADSATCYQILANSELHMEAMRHPSNQLRETAVSLRYHNLAVQEQRKRIGMGGVISDEMIGTASGLVVYAEISGIYEWWMPQRKGMIELIKARRRLKGEFEKEKRFLLRACCWVELRGAYFQDIPPLLDLPEEWVEEFEKMEVDDDKNGGLELSTRYYEDSVQWLNLFDSLRRLAKKVSERIKSGSKQESDLLVCTNVLTHRLLRIRPFRDDDGVLEACRLALLLFIAAIYRQFGAHPTNTTILVRKQTQHLTGREINWHGLETLRTWILCVSAFEASSREMYDWYVSEISEWKLWLPSIKTIAWVPELFDEKMSFLQSQLHQSS